MESSTSKILINILIVTAIALIGISVVSVLVEKPSEITATAPDTVEQITIEEPVTNTPTESTTTETTTSTSTATTAPKNSIGIIDTSWVWIRSTNDNPNITPKKVDAFSITFGKDGSIKGTTDCNTYFGKYTETSGKISFGPLGSTKMFCEGAQEGEFMLSLQGVSGYVIDKNNNLILSTGSGTMVFK